MNVEMGSVYADDTVLDFCLHPRADWIAFALASGQVQTCGITRDSDSRVHGVPDWHSKAAPTVSYRSLNMTPSGEKLWVASAKRDVCVLDAGTGSEFFSKRRDVPHTAGYTRICCLSETTAAVGDEDGHVELWDARAVRQGAVTGTSEVCTDQTDHITGLLYRAHDLIATSGDGTVALYDVRKLRLRARSEADGDDEYMSVAIVKNGKKMIVGTQSGALNIFSWGHFDDCSDRFPGHPGSVDAIVQFDEDTILTGSCDGGIRLLNIHPNRLIGVVGMHGAGDGNGDADSEEIEALALSFDKLMLASLAHSQEVRFWSLRDLIEDDSAASGGDSHDDGSNGSTSGDDDDHDAHPQPPLKRSRPGVPSDPPVQQRNGGRVSKHFFDDLL